MYNELLKLLNNSRSDYYKFRVSAILICKDGKQFYGVNVETSSPQAGICAERNALYSAISNGYKKDDFKELHVMVDIKSSSYPCYVCRQALSDFMSEDLPIFLYSNEKFDKKILLKEIVSNPFSKDDLI